MSADDLLAAIERRIGTLMKELARAALRNDGHALRAARTEYTRVVSARYVILSLLSNKEHTK